MMNARPGTDNSLRTPRFYKACQWASRFIKFQCVRETVLHVERVDAGVAAGGVLLACTHLSHLEPIVVSSIVRRQIRWMARIEFYQRWWGGAVLRGGGAFPVDRFGFSLPAVRRGIRLARAGYAVGVFPEGGVVKGKSSVLRGGRIKLGVCVISLRTNTPIIPVVVLGTEKLNRVPPWIPPRRARLYTAFGTPIMPPIRAGGRLSAGRAEREEMGARLRAGFASTYHELLAHTGLTDSDVP